MAKFLAILLSTFVLVGCCGGTSVTVENQSSVKVNDIQARGPGFAAHVGDLEPGERTEVKVYPSGEAGIGLTFSANSKEFKTPVSGYFESGYDVSVVISKDLSVNVDSEF